MTLKREIKDAYIENGNSVYIKTHSNAVYVNENETETLTERLDNVKGSITKHTSQLNDITQNISNLENDKQDKLTYFNVKNYPKLEKFIESDMTTLDFIKTLPLNSITTVTHNNYYTYKLTDIPTPNGVLVVFRGVSDGYLNATMFGTNGKQYFYNGIKWAEIITVDTLMTTLEAYQLKSV